MQAWESLVSGVGWLKVQSIGHEARKADGLVLFRSAAHFFKKKRAYSDQKNKQTPP
jgi:hypothetical protein